MYLCSSYLMVSMVSPCALHCMIVCLIIVCCVSPSHDPSISLNQNFTLLPLRRQNPYWCHHHLEFPGSQSSDHQYSKMKLIFNWFGSLWSFFSGVVPKYPLISYLHTGFLMVLTVQRFFFQISLIGAHECRNITFWLWKRRTYWIQHRASFSHIPG